MTASPETTLDLTSENSKEAMMPLPEIDNQKIEIERLREALRECADELAAELDARHPHRERYATIKASYERDMDVVYRARALLP